MTRRPAKRLLALFTAGMLCFVSPVYSDTFFVSQHGRQGNPGTEQEPFATLQEGVDQCGPGDQFVVLGGTYREAVRLSKSGMRVNPS